jgi:hypothetical protein
MEGFGCLSELDHMFDRDHPLLFTKEGKLDGMHISSRRAERPFARLAIEYSQLVKLGREVAINKNSISTAAEKVGVKLSTARNAIKRLRLIDERFNGPVKVVKTGPITGTCLKCGSTFETVFRKGREQRYCSKSCGGADTANRQRTLELECVALINNGELFSTALCSMTGFLGRDSINTDPPVRAQILLPRTDENVALLSELAHAKNDSLAADRRLLECCARLRGRTINTRHVGGTTTERRDILHKRYRDATAGQSLGEIGSPRRKRLGLPKIDHTAKQRKKRFEKRHSIVAP